MYGPFSLNGSSPKVKGGRGRGINLGGAERYPVVAGICPLHSRNLFQFWATSVCLTMTGEAGSRFDRPRLSRQTNQATDGRDALNRFSFFSLAFSRAWKEEGKVGAHVPIFVYLLSLTVFSNDTDFDTIFHLNPDNMPFARDVTYGFESFQN